MASAISPNAALQCKGLQTINPVVGGAYTWDCSAGNTLNLTAGAANVTVTMTNFKPGEDYVMTFVQDSVGSRTLTMSPVPTQGSAATLTPVTTATTGTTIYHFRATSVTAITFVAKQI